MSRERGPSAPSGAATDEAIDHIKAMITSGQVKPGDRMPREADLAAAIGVSRNSLREAVRALSLVRILDVRRGDGTYVSSLDGESLLEALDFLLDFRRDSSVMQFLEVRRILEPAAAALAARTMTPEEKSRLHTLLQESREVTSIPSLVRADLEFHSTIAAGSGNHVLASMVESVSMPTQRARIWRGLTQNDAITRTLDEHAAILEAIDAGDSELAAARTLVHVTGVLDWLRAADHESRRDGDHTD